ncbi:MAG: MTH938/NDUFAF3 family protein [Formivibrio sp.]|nr:MTH938/NDUFAF3 family protein [Formivibrio sp.]
MKLVQDKYPEINQFSGYGEQWVSVNGIRQQGSLLVSATALKPWRPAGFDDLQREDFTVVLSEQPELVLLGTGSRIRFPHPSLSRDLIEAGVGMEIMDVGALCRTFNALVGEGRKAVGLVLFD